MTQACPPPAVATVDAAVPAATGAANPPRRHRVGLLPSGWAFDVDDGESVLEAALRAGIQLPSSCRNGTCRSCRCQRVDGEVRYRVEWPGLSAEEKREAWMLPCVALPLSDLLIDAARARRIAAADASPAGPGGDAGAGPGSNAIASAAAAAPAAVR